MFNLNDHIRELRAAIVGLVLLLAATIIGFIWIGIGIYHALSISLGDVWGPVVLGLLYFIPIITYALAKTFRPAPPAVAEPSDPADAIVVNMSRVLGSLSGRAPFVVAVAAIIAGFLATRYPAILAFFTQLLSAYAEDVSTKPAQEGAADSGADTHSGNYHGQ